MGEGEGQLATLQCLSSTSSSPGVYLKDATFYFFCFIQPQMDIIFIKNTLNFFHQL